MLRNYGRALMVTYRWQPQDSTTTGYLFTSLALFHFLTDFSLILRFSEDFLSFILFFFSPPFYPSKIIYFSVTVCSLMCGVFEDLASFKKYFVIECLLKRRRYLIAIAARKDFCSISKIHPILMYNLRVSYTCRRSLVITCKQSVLLLVCRVLNVLINTKEKLGLQIDLCVFLNNDVFFNM